MLDVKRLKVLREVARSGSFSAAAEELGYTQPAISQQISALEREAGTRLLQRGARGVTLTDAAAAKAKALLDQEGRDDMHLRIAVQPGGCAGLKYQLFFDERTLDGDLFRDFGGIQVAVDRMSAPYVTNAVIDFVDSIEKQGFTIDNPNATGSCACGDSFH